MFSLETCKQFDALILEETNVKELSRLIANTEKGKLELVFNLESKDYEWRLGGEKVNTPTPRLDERINEIVSSHYEGKK